MDWLSRKGVIPKDDGNLCVETLDGTRRAVFGLIRRTFAFAFAFVPPRSWRGRVETGRVSHKYRKS